MSWATEFRPKTFDQVAGHSIAKTWLQAMCHKAKKQNEPINPLIILSGNSGIGKTTLARIFANELADSIDIREINASLFTGIDNIREMIEDAEQAPLAGDYKIFIADEVHMLSKASWNALLKTLEEPPKSSVFVLCTTELHKVPETIQSRAVCLHLNAPEQYELKAFIENILLNVGITCVDDNTLKALIDSSTNVREVVTKCEELYNLYGEQVFKQCDYELLTRHNVGLALTDEVAELFVNNCKEFCNKLPEVITYNTDTKMFVEYMINYLVNEHYQELEPKQLAVWVSLVSNHSEVLKYPAAVIAYIKVYCQEHELWK